MCCFRVCAFFFFRFFTFLRGFRFAGQTRSLPRLLSFSLTREATRVHGPVREELARGAPVFNSRERISASSWVLRIATDSRAFLRHFIRFLRGLPRASLRQFSASERIHLLIEFNSKNSIICIFRMKTRFAEHHTRHYLIEIKTA